MNTQDICKNELQNRIDAIETCVKSAKERLEENDYLQCAVRLQMAAEQGQFSELLMNISTALVDKKELDEGKLRRSMQ